MRTQLSPEQKLEGVLKLVLDKLEKEGLLKGLSGDEKKDLVKKTCKNIMDSAEAEGKDLKDLGIDDVDKIMNPIMIKKLGLALVATATMGNTPKAESYLKELFKEEPTEEKELEKISKLVDKLKNHASEEKAEEKVSDISDTDKPQVSAVRDNEGNIVELLVGQSGVSITLTSVARTGNAVALEDFKRDGIDEVFGEIANDLSRALYSTPTCTPTGG